MMNETDQQPSKDGIERRIAREPFVHILLFQCPDCTNPMSSAVATSERNPEETDARSFVLRCDCGWMGTLAGLFAKRHWVEEWF
jgi:hypothetical protein